MKISRNDSSQFKKNTNQSNNKEMKETLSIEMKKINKSINKIRINELLSKMNEKTIKNEEKFIKSHSIFDIYQKDQSKGENYKHNNNNYSNEVVQSKKVRSISNTKKKGNKMIKDSKFYIKQKEYEYIKQMKINHKKYMNRKLNKINENQTNIKKNQIHENKCNHLCNRLDKIISSRKLKQERLNRMYCMIDMIKSEREKEESLNNLNKYKTMNEYLNIDCRYNQSIPRKSRNISNNQYESHEYHYNNNSYSVMNNKIQEEYSFIPTINQKSEFLVKQIFPDGTSFHNREKIYKSIKEMNLDRINNENQSLFIPTITFNLPSYVRHSNINSYRINRSQLCEIVYYDNENEKLSKKDEKESKHAKQTITNNDEKKGIYNKKPIKSKMFNINMNKKIEKEGKGLKRKKEEMENSELKSTIYKSSYDLNIRDNTFTDDVYKVVIGNEKYLNIIKI